MFTNIALSLFFIAAIFYLVVVLKRQNPEPYIQDELPQDSEETSNTGNIPLQPDDNDPIDSVGLADLAQAYLAADDLKNASRFATRILNNPAATKSQKKTAQEILAKSQMS